VWGLVKVIASIEEPLVIEKILTHLKQQEAKAETIRTQQLNLLPDNRAALIHKLACLTKENHKKTKTRQAARLHLACR